MLVRRKSDHCKAVLWVEGMNHPALVLNPQGKQSLLRRYKGKPYFDLCRNGDWILESIHNPGLYDKRSSLEQFEDLGGGLVRFNHPVEPMTEWLKHGDHPIVKRLEPRHHFHKQLVKEGKNPDLYGLMLNFKGHENDVSPGDCVVGHKGMERRLLEKDRIRFEIVG